LFRTRLGRPHQEQGCRNRDPANKAPIQART